MKKHNLIYFPEITSTNTHALKNLDDYADGDVLVAEIQTEGRGRFDRKWVSDKPGNIYISFVLKPVGAKSQREIIKDDFIKGRHTGLPLQDCSYKYVCNIPQYLSVKLCEVLETYEVTPVIKWPNDVLIDNKKIAGILAQTSVRGNTFRGLVLGIGINLNFEREDMDSIDRPATSLNLVLDKKINRDEFLDTLLKKFFTDYDEFLETGFDFLKEDYVKRAYFLGNTITVNTYKTEVKGVAKRIADDGSLVILPESCENELNINMGEILEF